MSWPFIVVIVLASFILLRIMLFHIQVYFEEITIDQHFVKMRYKEFKALYHMAPERYELYHFKANGPCIKYVDDRHHYYLIYFPTCLEWLRAKRIFWYRNNEDLKRIRLEEKNRFLQSAQKDIDIFTEKLKGEEKDL